MAKYDVYRQPSGDGYLLDCQADLLSNLNTRFVVPLFPTAVANRTAPRLNPILNVGDEPYVLIDPFNGLGTTALACAQLGIDYVGIELDEQYLRAAVARIKAASLKPKALRRSLKSA